MIETQRRAYLEAMDIHVWVQKSATGDSPRLSIGPGSGSTLLICRDAGERSVAIAADICRFLGGDPVWAWPDSEQDPQNPSVKQAVDQQLFTRVVIFGVKLAERMFTAGVPAVLSSARILISADLDELALSGVARKALWTKLSDSSLVSGI